MITKNSEKKANNNYSQHFFKDLLFTCGRYHPKVEGSEEEIRCACYREAHSIYGEKLPDRIELRLEKELSSIIDNGYSSIFAITRMMTDKAHADEIPVGFRGAAGSSLVAFLLGITEVNPLPPHYVCPSCCHYEEPEDEFRYESGWGLPEKKCPVCGADMKRDGYRIPCEVLFGVRMDREPDLDFIVATGYKSEMLKVITDHFGEERVVYADTDRYSDDPGLQPGGVFILPEDEETYDFTPFIKSTDKGIRTLLPQIDYFDLGYVLTFFDVLEHDCLRHIKNLWELTGVNPKDIPLDDEDTICYVANYGESSAELKTDEEFYISGLAFELAKHILSAVKPESFSDLTKITAFINGTEVWEGNAEVLIEDGTADLHEVISTRDDILNYLLSLGMDEYNASVIMDRVRKGRELTDEMIVEMKEYGVPDWYIQSCGRMKYVFPKAHAIQYAMMYVRLLWYKVHYPEEYARSLDMQA